MPANSPPPGFDEPAPTAEDLRSLTSIGHAAVQTLEPCIVEHHAEIDYTDAERRAHAHPAATGLHPYNGTHRVMVWRRRTSSDHWEELRFDRIHEMRDTGEVFEQSW
jgi:hypothetical protein